MAAPRAPLDPSAIAAERIDESGFCASCSVRLFDMKREREKRKEKPRRASSSGPTSQLLFREIHTRRGLPTSEPTDGWVPLRVGPGCHCVVAPARRRWACGCVGGEGPHVPSSSGGPHIRRGLAGPVLAGGRSASGRL